MSDYVVCLAGFWKSADSFSREKAAGRQADSLKKAMTLRMSEAVLCLLPNHAQVA